MNLFGKWIFRGFIEHQFTDFREDIVYDFVMNIQAYKQIFEISVVSLTEIQ